MAELTLEEARKIYSESDSLKSLILTKFTKSELEENPVVTQSEFDKKLLELIGKCTKTVFFTEEGFPSTLPTNRIELRNIDGEWMLDIQFTGENKHFWASYNRIWLILAYEFSLQDDEIQRLMKNQMKIKFELTDVTPLWKGVAASSIY
jgi:hypothetical protein